MVSVNRLSSFLDAAELQEDAREVVLNPMLRHGDTVCFISLDR